MIHPENHKCSEHRKEYLATKEKPFHFVDSGLSYVYLVGIRYFECPCGRRFAEIPAVKQLMQLIARDTLAKPSALSGDEVKFLRKRLGMTQVDFAKALPVASETLCRYETGSQPVSESSDKLIRFFYIVTAEDAMLEPLRAKIKEWFAKWQEKTKSHRIIATMTNNEWELKEAA